MLKLVSQGDIQWPAGYDARSAELMSSLCMVHKDSIDHSHSMAPVSSSMLPAMDTTLVTGEALTNGRVPRRARAEVARC